MMPFESIQKPNQTNVYFGQASNVYPETLTRRLWSIERKVSETKQGTDQTHKLQQNMNDRLHRIEQHLQEKRPMRIFKNDVTDTFESPERRVTDTSQNMDQRLDRIEHKLQELQPRTELSVDHVSQRVVELLLRNEPFRIRMQANEESVKYKTIQEHDTIPLWSLGPNKIYKCERCDCTKRCNCICHSLNRCSNMEKRTDKESEKYFSSRRNNKPPNLQNTQGIDKQLLGATGGDPDESPSDDPSTDEHESYGHNRGNYLEKIKDKGTHIWKIDRFAWLKCINEGGDFEHQVECLLSEGKLPDQCALNEIRSKYANLSLVISRICDKVCVYIKEKSQKIAHVWAATIYAKDSLPHDNNIVFVVLTTDTSVKINDENFVIYQRPSLQVDETDRNKEIEKMEYNNPPTTDEIEKLEKCLKENAKSLMNNHSNLTRVTASWFRNDTERISLRKELCIALYVHIKGYIPVGEKYFPTEIGGYPVVVREGVFTLCKGPTEYHENVKMGCQIKAERVGTLGAFVEIENDNKLYGLTCAHVVFDQAKLKTILEKGVCEFVDGTGMVVNQPDDNTNYPALGTTVVAVYNSGGNELAGMEFALIQINQNRWPTEGTFPDDSDDNYLSAGFGSDTPFVFTSGNILKKRRLPCPVVYKYGSESKLTRGVCRVIGSSVRTGTHQDHILGMVLHDQIEIEKFNIESQFCKQGDSGALVFTKCDKQGLSAIGMIEGTFGDTNICICSPIEDVLKEIRRIGGRQCTLKRFLPPDSPSDSRMNDPWISAQLYNTVMSLSVNMSQLHDRLGCFNQGFAQHKQEISTELVKQHYENLERTLGISFQQKVQREELKIQSEELKRQGKELEKQREVNKMQNEELKKQGEKHIKQSQKIKELLERREKQSEELKEGITRQSDDHVKQSREIKVRQERQVKELQEELKRQGDKHIKQCQEIKETQEKQGEELKRQGEDNKRQNLEIKHQTSQILALLSQQKS